jgi:hypothetical protein
VSATTVAASEPVREEEGLATAYRLLWLAVVFDLLAFGVGFDWDRRWHATHAFEDFFSPPHLFIYSMHLCATITLAYIAFTPDLRRWFGPTFSLPLVPFPIPGAIGLAGAGFGVVALAGVFDAIWHTTFGLDETNWSFPHSMLGWGLFVAFLGITSCRIAIAHQVRVEGEGHAPPRALRPIGWPSAVVFGFLIAATSAERFAGPLATNLSPEVIQYISRIPVLASEPAFQHTTRIYLTADIHRYNPLFVPLISLSAGMMLGLLHSFSPHRWLMVGLAALLSWTTTLIPYLVPAVIVAIGRDRQGSPAVWFLAGVGFVFTTAATWQGTLGGALIGVPMFIIGSVISWPIWEAVAFPTRIRVLKLTTLLGIVVPVLTGIVDLMLRARIP